MTKAPEFGTTMAPGSMILKPRIVPRLSSVGGAVSYLALEFCTTCNIGRKTWNIGSLGGPLARITVSANVASKGKPVISLAQTSPY